jgi:cellulose synthase/poly-beta-1,6-N-acetylglucosamine synthase-like glycosyltransferase
MTLLEIDLSILFVIAVILIWFTIAYQFILTVFGFVNNVRSLKERREVDAMKIDFPTCTILIPAHNEEKVIAQTLDAMLKLRYPKEKLKVVVINDGSHDQTKQIVEDFVIRDSRIDLFNVPTGAGGKGKSRALNLALSHVESEIVAIYDADNTPDEWALHYLVAQLVLHKELGAVIGKFRTINKNETLLTKFINIETLSFQSMLQAGRWQMHKIATLPGTNYVMRTDLIHALNGWDEDALTEDSELSIRIYKAGFKIKFIPYAITYEQEPQTWKVWTKQRTRWVKGNNYVVAKYWKEIPKLPSKRLAFDLLYTLSLYYVFFAAVVFSDILFAISVMRLVSISLPGPYTFVWITAIILFIFEIWLTISYDDEDTAKNFGLIILMYFTYCQFWIFIVIKSAYEDYIKREKHHWEKTARYNVTSQHTHAS